MRIYHVPHRLLPWILLSLISLGIGCGPLGNTSGSVPSIQIYFHFSDGTPPDLARLDLITTLQAADGTVENQGYWQSVASGGLIDQPIWFNLPGGSRGLASVDLTAYTGTQSCGSYRAQTTMPIAIEDESQHSVDLLLTKEASCLLTVQYDNPLAPAGSATAGSVDVYWGPPAGPMQPYGNCGLACYYHVPQASSVRLDPKGGTLYDLSGWTLDMVPQKGTASLMFDMGSDHKVGPDFVPTSCTGNTFCDAKWSNPSEQNQFTAIWGRELNGGQSGQELWVVGHDGPGTGVVYHYDGSQWQMATCQGTGMPTCSYGNSGQLTSASGDPQLSGAWVVGPRSANAPGIYYCTVGTNGMPACADVHINSQDMLGNPEFKSVSVAGGTVWLATSGGAVYAGTPDLKATPVSLTIGPSSDVYNSINQIWAISATEAVAVGSSESVRHCTLPAPGGAASCTNVIGQNEDYSAVAPIPGSPQAVWVAGPMGVLDNYNVNMMSGGTDRVVKGVGSITALWPDNTGTPGVWATQTSLTNPLVYWSEAMQSLTIAGAPSSVPPSDDYVGVWASGNDVWMVGQQNGSIAHFHRN